MKTKKLVIERYCQEPCNEHPPCHELFENTFKVPLVNQVRQLLLILDHRDECTERDLNVYWEAPAIEGGRDENKEADEEEESGIKQKRDLLEVQGEAGGEGDLVSKLSSEGR